MKQKLLYFKTLLIQTMHKYPHVFLLGAFIVLTFVVSLVNDAYFGSIFEQTRPNTVRPEVITPVYMNVVEVAPETGIKQSFDSFMQFTVSFSENLDPASIKVTSSPQHPLGFEVQENKVRVFPLATWEFDLGYEVTIEAKATSGLTLKDPYVYSMYITLPADTSVFETF